jgi:hypothetical protein
MRQTHTRQQRRPLAPDDHAQAQLTGVDVRLVKVSVNPAGRYGAPETEPGPFGVGSRVEDGLMRIPCHKASRRLCW